MNTLTPGDIEGMVLLTTTLVRKVGKKFLRTLTQESRNVVDLQIGGREVKLAADKLLEDQLLSELCATDISILSEETGFIDSNQFPTLLWVVDPLDGSYNFSRSLGPSMISVALWEGNTPVLGVLFNLVTKQLSFGGPTIGTYVEDVQARVSDRSERGQATLCTGFPSRFPIDDLTAVEAFVSTVRSFGKIRMIGAASASLWLVATGSADIYAEHNIMFWDVAAGLALVNGAGGTFEIDGVDLTRRVHSEPCTVVASNGKFDASVAIFDGVRGLA